MNERPISPWLAAMGAVLAALSLAGCSGPRPIAYSHLGSTPYLRPTRDDANGRTPYVFAVPVNWRQYHRVIIDPVEIYDGPDAQFGRIPSQGQAYLARVMQQRFTTRLARDFTIVTQPAPDTLRIHLTLTGASATPPVIGTLSHFDLAGGSYNAVQGLRGKPGMVSGAVVYAVEIRDARSGQLLRAEVTRQYPAAMNIGASFGPMKAAEKGIEKGAEALARRITGNDEAIAPTFRAPQP